jgi:hypothetical protein
MMAVSLFQAMDCGDVGMVERRQKSGFPFEASEALFVQCKLLGKDFDCYLTLQTGIFSQIDLSHAASSKLAQYFITLGQSYPFGKLWKGSLKSLGELRFYAFKSSQGSGTLFAELGVVGIDSLTFRAFHMPVSP